MRSGGGAALDIILKGHGGVMEMVVGVGRVGARGRGRSSEPRQSCHVRLRRRPSAAGFNQMVADGRTAKGWEGVIKKERCRKRESEGERVKLALNLAYDCTPQIYCHSLIAPRVMQRFLQRFCYENSLTTLNKLHMALAECFF